MKRSRLILLVILSAGLSAGITSWLVKRWHPDADPKTTPAPASHHDQDFHQWLHANLDLTPEQQAALGPAEKRFDTERARLLDELKTVSGDLAHALGDPARDSADLKPLMEKRHRLQGQLQQLTMAHLLEKRAQLTPAQQERYREWIHRSISHDHGD